MIARCVRCGGPDGVHGMVHRRYGNGAGGNVPCPVPAAQARAVAMAPDLATYRELMDAEATLAALYEGREVGRIDAVHLLALGIERARRDAL